jgi:hypothetical protein
VESRSVRPSVFSVSILQSKTGSILQCLEPWLRLLECVELYGVLLGGVLKEEFNRHNDWWWGENVFVEDLNADFLTRNEPTL